MMRRTSATLAVILVAGLVGTACGDDDSGDGDDSAPSGSTIATVESDDVGASATTTTSNGPVPSASTDDTDDTDGTDDAGSADTVTTVALGPDEQAVADVYRTVIWSEGAPPEKLALVQDAQGLRPTLTKYLEVAETVNGIDVAVTAVEITGDEAVVTYDLMLAGSPVYPDQEGRVTKAGGEWLVPRDEFCGVVAHVPEVSCPS